MASPSDAAAALHRAAVARPPTLGGGRLVCIDGPAGSGKTTVAAAFAEHRPDALVIHMDDLYDGWSGLATVGEQLGTLLRPLAADQPGRYRRYDWDAGAFAEEVEVPPGPWLVVEGVGAGHADFAHLHTVLAWLTAASDVRHRRWVEREGSAAWWDAWSRGEAAHFRTDRTRQRADVVIET